ncbi:MAG: hypothetical protein SFX74_12220, partial [Fimbriimonadaceae bacterium]|nr:hypothetical protein [Fimbriimonadaceae bacterium]
MTAVFARWEIQPNDFVAAMAEQSYDLAAGSSVRFAAFPGYVGLRISTDGSSGVAEVRVEDEIPTVVAEATSWTPVPLGEIRANDAKA